MEEWRTYKINEVCQSVSETYRGNATSVVLINTSDVLDGEFLNHEKVPNKDLKGQFKKVFYENDILYSEIRPANKRFAFVGFEPQDYIASTKLMVIRANDKVLPRFLFHHLKSDQTICELQALAESRSGTFPQITFSELGNLEISLPPIETQERIVGFLDSIENKIALNNRINHNLEEQAQALYKSWFVDFEPFKDGKFVESELGMIPEGWSIVSFKDFLTPVSRKVPVGMFPEYSVTNNGIIPRSEKFKKQLSGNSSQNKELRKYDIVFGMSREILNWGIMLDKIGSVSSAYNIYDINEDVIHPLYLKYYMEQRTAYFNDLIGTAAREGQSLDKGALMQKYAIIPPSNVLSSFMKSDKIYREQIVANESEISSLESLRDSILPQLMCGKLNFINIDC